VLTLAIAGGIAVGFALGLTGGGGGIFAVPILHYGLMLPAREAVGVSLAAVGATALVGAVGRIWHHETDIATGLIFAAGGMVAAPFGAQIAARLPEAWLLLLFSGLMVVVATRMWQHARCAPPASSHAAVGVSDQAHAATAPRRRVALLAMLGTTAGVLSGMFGVGGGFVIVPALVLFGGLSIRKAVATSLLAIFLISTAGVTSYVVGGGAMSWSLAALFAAGGVVGMLLGTKLASRLSAPALQQVFAVAMVSVAGFMVFKSIV
jgi:uncharacterized membrane protein YfcA